MVAPMKNALFERSGALLAMAVIAVLSWPTAIIA